MKKIKDYFDDYFRTWDITLPQDELDSHDPDMVAQICKAGWAIWYRFGVQDGKWFMDFYASHRMTNDRHKRVWEDGNTEVLPVPPPFLLLTGKPETDKKREEEYHRENREVAALLAAKGFVFTGNESLAAQANWQFRLDEKEDEEHLRALYGAKAPPSPRQ